MISTRLRDLREDNDVKQTTLAQYLCVKQSTYSDYENEVINVPVEALMKIADFYNTSVYYIIKWTDVRTPHKRKVCQ